MAGALLCIESGPNAGLGGIACPFLYRTETIQVSCIVGVHRRVTDFVSCTVPVNGSGIFVPQYPPYVLHIW